MTRFSLKQLRYFVAAGQTQSVTRAAEQTFVSQPSISAAIAHLEAVFGVQLFIRHHAQGLSLTPAGRRLMAQAAQLLKQAENLHQYAIDLGQTLSGRLDVGCFLTLAPILMPSLIKGFKLDNPDLEINCREGDHEQLLAGLRDGAYELAFVYDLEGGEEVTFLPLAEIPPHAILPADHRLAKRKRIKLNDLIEEPLVLLDLPHSRDYFARIFRDLKLTPRIAHRTPSPNMVRSLVANGFGYALLNVRPTFDRAMDGKAFAAVALSDDLPPLRMGIAQAQGLQLTKAAETFAQFARAHAQKGGLELG
ncbi:MAG: LysR family transcriptional regulator [Pseudomonadota bacterium]